MENLPIRTWSVVCLSCAMPSFNVGDRVERIGVLVPIWMKIGIITKVIPNEHGIEWATQYEVRFGEIKGTFYQTELSRIKIACERH